METCEQCGGDMHLIRAENPALSRCVSCGHELSFLWDPAPPPDPHGDADGLLVIDAFNGRNKQAVLIIKHALDWTPAQSLQFLRDNVREVFWSWGDGLHHLVDLQQRLTDLGVSCRIERVRGR